MKVFKMVNFVVYQLKIIHVCYSQIEVQMAKPIMMRNVLRERRPPGEHLAGLMTTEHDGPGPTRGFKYNPNYGYDPYWKDGEWVFVTEDPNATRLPYMLCDTGCHMMYHNYGVICGRNRWDVYQTFNSYCEMVNLDCKDRRTWRIAYRGPCHDRFTTINTRTRRAIKNYHTFRERFYNQTTPSTTPTTQSHRRPRHNNG